MCTMLLTASEIFWKSTLSVACSILPTEIISAISQAWMPMRSISVTIFKAAEIVRRSLATGCCCIRSFRQIFSMLRSCWLIWLIMLLMVLARLISPFSRASTVSWIASSQRPPI